MLALLLLTTTAHTPREACEASASASAARMGTGALLMNYPALREGITLHNTPFGPSQTRLMKKDVGLQLEGGQPISPIIWSGPYKDLMLATSTLDGTLPIAVHPFGDQETWYIREDLGLTAISYQDLLVGNPVLLYVYAADRVQATPSCGAQAKPSSKIVSGAPYTVLAVEGHLAQVASMWDTSQTPLGWVPWYGEGRAQFRPVTDLEMESLTPETSFGPQSLESIELATFCTGDPATVPFRTTQELEPYPLCYLPAGSTYETHFTGETPGGRIALAARALSIDPLNLHESCSGEESEPATGEAQRAPEELILRVPEGHRVTIEARVLEGYKRESEFVSTGWSELVPITTGHPDQSGLLRVPITTLVGEAQVATEVHISAGPYSTSLLLHWPISC